MKIILLNLFILLLVISCTRDNDKPDNASILIETSNDSLRKIIDSLKHENEIYKEGFYKNIHDTLNDNLLYEISRDGEICGLATIKGYYTEKEKLDWGDKLVHCDCFVVTTGPSKLNNYLLERIKNGNLVNYKNEKNQPVINLCFSNLSEKDVVKIKKSTADSVVKLTVFVIPPTYSEVSVCYSIIDIVKIF